MALPNFRQAAISSNAPQQIQGTRKFFLVHKSFNNLDISITFYGEFISTTQIHQYYNCIFIYIETMMAGSPVSFNILKGKKI